MTKVSLLAILLLLFYSCTTGLKVSSAELKPITREYKAAIADQAAHFQGRNLRNYFPDSLHRLFDMKGRDVDTVYISFLSDQQLQLSFKEDTGIKTRIYNGRFSKKGYFEVYLSKENIQIPPLFPIFFSRRNINRLQVALTNEGAVIVDHRWVREGNFLFVGSGDKCLGRYYFKTATRS